MKEQLSKIADYYNISSREFSRKIGRSEGYSNTASNITVDVLKNILDVFPDIDVHWLITGKGEMIKKEENEFSSDTIEIIKQQLQTINSQQRTIEELIKKIQGDTAVSA